MTGAVTLESRPIGWLRGPAFDLTLVVGSVLVALTPILFVHIKPDLFGTLFVANMWLLGFHHVVATFTRIAFDKQSLKENRFLVFALPLLLFAVVAGLGYGIGRWFLASIYFYSLTFHYTRQS